MKKNLLKGAFALSLVFIASTSFAKSNEITVYNKDGIKLSFLEENKELIPKLENNSLKDMFDVKLLSKNTSGLKIKNGSFINVGTLKRGDKKTLDKEKIKFEIEEKIKEKIKNGGLLKTGVSVNKFLIPVSIAGVFGVFFVLVKEKKCKKFMSIALATSLLATSLGLNVDAKEKYDHEINIKSDIKLDGKVYEYTGVLYYNDTEKEGKNENKEDKIENNDKKENNKDNKKENNNKKEDKKDDKKKDNDKKENKKEDNKEDKKDNKKDDKKENNDKKDDSKKEEKVAFEDENLKEILLNLFKNYNGTDGLNETVQGEYEFKLKDKNYKVDKDRKELYVKDLEQIEALALRGITTDENFDTHPYEFKSIKGIERAKNLKQLTISSGFIPQEDSDDFKNGIFYSKGSFSDISSLKDLKNLELLRLSHNNIEDVTALKGLKNLKHLYLSHNKIKDIKSLKDLTSLESFDISKNKIEDISVLENFKNLKLLALKGSNIESLDKIKDLTKLEILTADDNKISDIEVLKNLVNLKELCIDKNNIKDFDAVKNLTKLETLTIENQKIKSNVKKDIKEKTFEIENPFKIDSVKKEGEISVLTNNKNIRGEFNKDKNVFLITLDDNFIKENNKKEVIFDLDFEFTNKFPFFGDYFKVKLTLKDIHINLDVNIPEGYTKKQILLQFIKTAKSKLLGVLESDDLNSKNIEIGTKVQSKKNIEKFKNAIKHAEDIAKDVTKTEDDFSKETEILEKQIDQFKPIEGEKEKSITPYVKDDFMISSNKILGFTKKGEEKLKNNNFILKIPQIDGVDTIERLSFSNKGIKVLEIPKNIKTINEVSFIKNGIVKLTLNEGIKKICDRAFIENNFNFLKIPSTLNDIGYNAFKSCSISEVYFEDGITKISKSSFSENAISKIRFPKTLESIDLGAFKSNLMEEIDFPDGLKTIAPKIFCRNRLRDVTIPNSLEVFCANSFRLNPGFSDEKTFNMKLKDIVYIKSLDNKTIEEKLNEVVKARPYIFQAGVDDKKTKLEIENWTLLKEDGDLKTYAAKFEQLTKEKLDSLLSHDKSKGTSSETVIDNLKKIRLIVKVKISNETLGIWDSDNFVIEENKIKGFTKKGKDKLKENKDLNISNIEGVDEISDKAFMKKNLKSVIIPSNIKVIGKNAFAGNLLEKITFNEGLEKIEENAFLMQVTKKIDFPNSLKIIKDKAFMSNKKKSNLKEITFGKNLEYIGKNAFSNNKLQNVKFNEKLSYIDDLAFKNNEISEISFNKDIKKITCASFLNNKLKKVTLPLGLEKLCMTAFDKDVDIFISEKIGTKDLSLEKIKEKLKDKIKLKILYGKKIKEYDILDWEIKDDVADALFRDDIKKDFENFKLKVKIDKASKEIEDIKNSETLDVDENKRPLKNKEDWKIDDFNVEDGKIVSIKNKEKLKENPHVKIFSKDKMGKKITKIGKALFSRQLDSDSSLKISSLEIEDGIEEIEDSAFSGNFLKDVVIPNSVLKIGKGSFSNNTTLKTVKLSEKLKEIPQGAFSLCQIESLKMPDSIEVIGERAFTTNNLKEIKFSKNLKKIKKSAFQGNKSLSKIFLPSSLEEIGSMSFSHCDLTKINLNSNLKKIKSKAFYYNNLEDVLIPNSVIELNKNAFDKNNSINLNFEKLKFAIENLETEINNATDKKEILKNLLNEAKEIDEKNNETLDEVEKIVEKINKAILENKKVYLFAA